MIKKLRLILIVAFVSLTTNPLFSAGSDSDDSSNYLNNYKEAKALILRADKLEQKNKKDKAQKLYIKAIEKLELAYKAERRNPDVLNYMGYSLRKTGKFNEAEKFYLMGLKIKPGHNGINEYLGELYIKTNRIDLAKERLEVLENCNCKESSELKALIDKH